MTTSERENNGDFIELYIASCSSCGWEGDLEINNNLVLELSAYDEETGGQTVQGYLDVLRESIASSHNFESQGCKNPSISISR